MEKKREQASPDITARRLPPNLKKPYAKPHLTDYGSVAKLTRASAGSIGDGGGGGMMKVCL